MKGRTENRVIGGSMTVFSASVAVLAYWKGVELSWVFFGCVALFIATVCFALEIIHYQESQRW